MVSIFCEVVMGVVVVVVVVVSEDALLSHMSVVRAVTGKKINHHLR